MALNIKNKRVETLVARVAELTGESKTEAVRKAMEERLQRLTLHVVQREREAGLRHFLEQEVWPMIPEHERGRRLSAEEEAAILGYGPEGV